MLKSTKPVLVEIGTDTPLIANLGYTKTEEGYSGYVDFRNGALNADQGRMPWYALNEPTPALAMIAAYRHWRNLTVFAQKATQLPPK